MSNLLKPTVDGMVFTNRAATEPLGCRLHRDNSGFLARDDARKPVAERVAGFVRSVAAAAVLPTGFASPRRT
jgi:hypothetical protein